MAAGSRTVRVDILGDSRSAQKAFGDAAASSESFGSKVGNVGKAAGVALAGVSLAAGAMAVDAVRQFSAFESGMNEVFTLIPSAGQKTFDKLTQQTKDFSREFGVLPDKVVPALYQSLSAGVPPDNVFAFLETAQKAAKGGVTDLETAVNGITSVVNAYGVEMVDAAKASDLMFTAVRLGKTDFGQLSSSLFHVIPTAASLGVQFEDITAALARMTAQGTPTSVATTQLRAALQEAATTGSELDVALRDLTGKSFPELIAGGQDIGTIFNNLRTSMPDEEFRNLFGSTEALSAVLGITGPQAEAFQLALAEMGNSAGATEAAFKQMDRGIGPSMERIRANIAVARIEIGERLAPVVDKLLSFILYKLIPGLLGFIAVFREGGVLAVLGEVRDLAGQAGEKILQFGQNVIDALGRVDWGGIAGDLLDGLLGGLATVADFGSRFVSWATEQLSNVDWSGEASAAGRALLDGLIAGFDTAQDFGGRVASWVTDKISGIDWTGSASSAGGAILDGIVAGWEATTGYGGRFVDWFVGQITDIDYKGTGAAVLNGIEAGWKATTDYGGRFVGWLWEQIKGVAGTDWGGVGSAILDGIVDGWNTVTKYGQRFIDWFVGTFSDVEWGKLGQTILDGIIKGFNTAKGWGEQFVKWVDGVLQGVEWDSVGATILEGINTALEKLQANETSNKLIEALQPFFDMMRDDWTRIVNNFATSIDAARDSVNALGLSLGVDGDMASSAKFATEMLVVFAVGPLVLVTKAILLVSEVTRDMAVSFNNAVQFIRNDVIPVFQELWDKVQTVWDTGKGIPYTVNSGINAVKDAIVGVLRGGADTIQGIWDSTWDAMLGKVQTVVDAIKGIVSGVINGVNAAINSINAALSFSVSIPHNTITDFLGIGGASWSFNPPDIPTIGNPFGSSGGGGGGVGGYGFHPLGGTQAGIGGGGVGTGGGEKVPTTGSGGVGTGGGYHDPAHDLADPVPPPYSTLQPNSPSNSRGMGPIGGKGGPPAQKAAEIAAALIAQGVPADVAMAAAANATGQTTGGGTTYTGTGSVSPFRMQEGPGVAIGCNGGTLMFSDGHGESGHPSCAVGGVWHGIPADMANAGLTAKQVRERTYNGGDYTGLGGGNYIPGSAQAYEYAAQHGGVVLSGSGLVGYKRDPDADEWHNGGGLRIEMDGHRVGWLTGRRHMQGKQMRRTPQGC